MTENQNRRDDPPGSAYSALLSVRETVGRIGSVEQLANLYDRLGLLLHTGGIGAASIVDFVDILEAVTGFVGGLPWLKRELLEARPPEASWPRHIWLEVGSFDSPAVPQAWSGYSHAFADAKSRGIWFNPDRRILNMGTSLATNPFEGAVHELGHLTMARLEAEGIIEVSSRQVFGNQNPGGFVSLYAAESRPEFWAEATLGANTDAWSRIPALGRPRIRDFVAIVNQHSDEPLI